MNKNKLNFDIVRQQIEIFLPEDMRKPILATLDICGKKVVVAKNKCDTAYKWVDILTISSKYI